MTSSTIGLSDEAYRRLRTAMRKGESFSEALVRLLPPVPRLPSPHRVAIILRFDEKKSDEFERYFEKEVLPLWHQFKAQGKFQSAVLSRIVDDHIPEGIQAYLLEAEIASHEAHDEFDEYPSFLSFLDKAKPMQPMAPDVWLGEPLFQV